MIDGRRVQYEPILSNEPEGPEGHDSFPYGRFHPDPRGEYVEPESMGYSDYSGSTYSRSNIRVFMEQFAELQGTEWWLLHGAHGTEAVVVRIDADERHPELGEFFDALSSYPIADENDHSNLEMELEDEAWNSYGHDDFRRWLLDLQRKWLAGEASGSGLFPRNITPIIDEFEPEVALRLLETLFGVDFELLDDGDDAAEARLNELWFDAVHNGSGDEVRHEDAVNVYFDFKRGMQSYLRNGVDQSTLRVTLDMLTGNGGEWTPQVEKLAKSARKKWST